MCLQMIGIIINQMFVWNQNKALSNEYQDIDDEELIDHCLHNFCFNLKNNYFMSVCLYERIYNGVWKTNKLIPEKYYRLYKIMVIMVFGKQIN